MNTDTGNIFALDGKPLAQNEIELTQQQLKELFPIRDLGERLDAYKAMRQRYAQLVEEMNPLAAPKD
jgi:hypothetical protein